MKFHQRWVTTALLVIASCVATFAHAAAVSGQGTWETTLQGRDLDGNLATVEAYYDTALGITWLADAGYAGGVINWVSANAWATGLNPYSSGITGWRLPTVSPVDGTTDDDATFSNIGIEDTGYNVSAPGTLYAGSTASELAHMFFNTLGNKAYCDPLISTVSTCNVQAGWGPTNTGPFANLAPSPTTDPYWSATGYAPTPGTRWYFNFYQGLQTSDHEVYTYAYAWAVHSGDVGADTGDSDGDGIPNAGDNCTLVPNNEAGTVPSSPGVLKSQLDADQDGYGNVCDGDLNNSGLTTAQDNTILRNLLNQAYNFSANAAASDLNGSGLVTAQDNTILRNRLNTAPGPSGLACAGTIPCP